MTYYTIENIKLKFGQKKALFTFSHTFVVRAYELMWTSISVQLTERITQRCYQDNALDNTRAGEAEAVKDGSLGPYRQVSKSLGP